MQEEAGTEVRHAWGRIDPRFDALDLDELFEAGSGWLRLDGELLCYQVVPSVQWLVCVSYF